MSLLKSLSFDCNLSEINFNSNLLSLEIPETPSCLQWWRDDENMILVGGENSFLASYDLRTGKVNVEIVFIL